MGLFTRKFAQRLQEAQRKAHRGPHSIEAWKAGETASVSCACGLRFKAPDEFAAQTAWLEHFEAYERVFDTGNEFARWADTRREVLHEAITLCQRAATAPVGEALRTLGPRHIFEAGVHACIDAITKAIDPATLTAHIKTPKELFDELQVLLGEWRPKNGEPLHQATASIQREVGVPVDGLWGEVTAGAVLRALDPPPMKIETTIVPRSLPPALAIKGWRAASHALDLIRNEDRALFPIQHAWAAIMADLYGESFEVDGEVYEPTKRHRCPLT